MRTEEDAFLKIYRHTTTAPLRRVANFVKSVFLRWLFSFLLAFGNRDSNYSEIKLLIIFKQKKLCHRAPVNRLAELGY